MNEIDDFNECFSTLTFDKLLISYTITLTLTRGGLPATTRSSENLLRTRFRVLEYPTLFPGVPERRSYRRCSQRNGTFSPEEPRHDAYHFLALVNLLLQVKQLLD